MPTPRIIEDLSIPVDGNQRAVSVLYGYDPVNDNFYPLTVTDNGDGTFILKSIAVLEGTVTVGDVIIKDPNTGNELFITNHKQLSYSDDSPMNKDNITTIYTYVDPSADSPQVQTVKEYPSGALSGAPAKLTTYTYDSYGNASSISVTDTTV